MKPVHGDSSREGDDALPLTFLRCEEVIALLSEALTSARREHGNDVRALLGFDGDGTLWSGDIGVELFEALLQKGASRDGLRPEVAEALAEEARRHGVATDAIGARGAANIDVLAVAHALHEAFKSGRYPDRDAYAMHAWVFAGRTESEMTAFADEALSALAVDDRFNASMPPVLAWARENGVDAYVVSASPRAGVVRAARGLGFAADRVLAMTPAAAEGALLPRVEEPITYGEGKFAAIRGARPDAIVLGGFGDSGWDAAMLRASKVPVAVNPQASLLSVAASIPGLVAIKG